MSSQQNEIWRPCSNIRAKAIGIPTWENRLLVCEVREDGGKVKGWCPLGGGIEFGETSESALKREFFEELGCEIEIKGDPVVCENIFDHHGVLGHEIVFAFQIHLNDGSIYQRDRFQIQEHNGTFHWVEWIAIERFQTKELILYPLSLISHISKFLLDSSV